MIHNDKIKLGILYGFIVLVYLSISWTLRIPHMEWGLLTTSIIFIPNYKRSIQSAVERISGTIIGIATIILMYHLVPNNSIRYFVMLLVLLFGHMTIRWNKIHNFIFYFTLTLGIFGIGSEVNLHSDIYTNGLKYKIIQVVIGSLIASISLFIYAKTTSLETDETSQNQILNQPPHYDLFHLRGIISYLTLICIYFITQSAVVWKIGMIFTILLSVTSIIKNPPFCFFNIYTQITLIVIILCCIYDLNARYLSALSI
ncbi:FUSC family protein [Halosquirtibacter xylanolyticus]|uniref:FUSC family protein n=1 Tax=Halosquirtibacter xylanolyticus TaxID=3374599 RepID=UPI00374A3069|nr:FUSC family protein [Prolixibacteraceae bacterium]